MICPLIPARVIEGHYFTGQWICCLYSRVFVVVALLTCIGKIFQQITATFRNGMDVLDRECVRRIFFLREAIFTTVMSTCFYRISLCGLYTWSSHDQSA